MFLSTSIRTGFLFQGNIEFPVYFFLSFNVNLFRLNSVPSLPPHLLSFMRREENNKHLVLAAVLFIVLPSLSLHSLTNRTHKVTKCPIIVTENKKRRNCHVVIKIESCWQLPVLFYRARGVPAGYNLTIIFFYFFLTTALSMAFITSIKLLNALKDFIQSIGATGISWLDQSQV